jgi:ribosomal protein S10
MVAKKDKQKIRIVIKSFDHKVLDESIKKIVMVCTDSGAKIV